MTAIKKANYLVKLYKQLNKSLDYTINMIVWYSMTEAEDKEIENHIRKIW